MIPYCVVACGEPRRRMDIPAPSFCGLIIVVIRKFIISLSCIVSVREECYSYFIT